MRILVLNADYPRFLDWLYDSQFGLDGASYAVQMSARNASLFGVADFYSRNFAALGHSAAEIHVNNARLQAAWARERGMAIEEPAALVRRSTSLPGWLLRATAPFKPMLRPLARKIGLAPGLDNQAETILLAQIEDFKPDVVLNQDTFYVDVGLMRRIKSIGNPILVGQIGVTPSRGVDWSVYDLILSQLPSTVSYFRRLGVRAEVNHLAFEPAVLEFLPPAPDVDIEVSFVGTVSPDHRQRVALLEAVAQRYDLKLFGNPPRALPVSSPLHRCFQSEVWGAEMYQVLRRSKISLNSHIDMAGREAGNMRLFEATGVGAFLLTDFKDNLHTLFAPGREVAAWRSIDDCLEIIARAARDGEGCAAVAAAGQARTLAQHTYRHRAAEILQHVATLRASP
jgi:hypothetical protein